ncbi:hypothetical protein AB0J52_01520 [Spirillospora sp. NPDC049652]
MTPPPLPLHWFEEELRVLPTELALRVQRMRAGATRGYGCTTCAVVRQRLGFGFAAARHDDGEGAERLVGEVEHYATHGTHPANCPHLPPIWSRRARRNETHGTLPEWADVSGRLIAPTDASYKGLVAGCGYVLGDGRWGMRGWTVPSSRRPVNVVVAKLNGVALLMENAAPDVLLALAA